MTDPDIVVALVAAAGALIALTTLVLSVGYVRLDIRHRTLRHDYCQIKSEKRALRAAYDVVLAERDLARQGPALAVSAVEAGEGAGRRRIEYVGESRIFDLLEGVANRLMCEGIGDHQELRAGFARSTGGVDMDWCIEKLASAFRRGQPS
jgi:hypothetical protein